MGDQLSASDYNRLAEEVERLSGIRTEPPLDMVDTPGGPIIRLDVSQLLSDGIPPGSVFNYYNDTFNSTNDTYNYTNDTFNYYGTDTQNIYGALVTNISGSWVINASGTGYLQINAPLEICGNQFWCCTTVTFPNPPTAPTLGQTPGGALAGASPYVKITYVTPNGESAPSPEATFNVSANNLLTVASPAALYSATGYNVYASTTLGAEKLQNASPIAIGTGWTEPTTGLTTTGAAPPASHAVNNWILPAAKTVFNITPATAGSTITGIVPAQIGGASGPQIIEINNVGTGGLTLSEGNINSAATNQIILPPTYGSAVVLQQNDAAELWYDTCTSNEWRLENCTVDIDAGGSVTGTYYTVALGSNVGFTGATSILPLTILTAGTYLITADVEAQCNGGGTAGTFAIKAWLQNGAAIIPNSYMDPININNATATEVIVGSASSTVVVASVAANAVIAIYAQSNDSTPSVTHQINGVASPNGMTRLTAVRIA